MPGLGGSHCGDRTGPKTSVACETLFFRESLESGFLFKTHRPLFQRCEQLGNERIVGIDRPVGRPRTGGGIFDRGKKQMIAWDAFALHQHRREADQISERDRASSPNIHLTRFPRGGVGIIVAVTYVPAPRSRACALDRIVGALGSGESRDRARPRTCICASASVLPLSRAARLTAVRGLHRLWAARAATTGSHG